MELKPGYRTTELLTTIAVLLGVLVPAIQGSLPPKWAAVAAAVAAAAYNLSRGITKAGVGRNDSRAVSERPVDSGTRASV